MPLSRHLYLTGFRGTGKTSVGARLAESLKLPLIDLDHLIEDQSAKTIREIFERGGESSFRDFETQALARVSLEPPAIVSLGGGAILRQDNRDVIARTGICFWLDADPETIAARIAADAASATQRPPLTSLDGQAEIRQLLTTRRSLYQAAADHRIDTCGKTIEEVANEILLVLAN